MAEVILWSEPLYLDKEGANDIYINNCQLLKQHQIDGLRFLYTHFKKKKSGIVVNYPERCGKSVTVVLFLYALRDLIKKPILILCREDEMICWKNYFLKWTEYTEDDIIIDPPKLVKGKKIFITNAGGSPFYRSQSWSITVVKEDNISKDLSWILDADYRIWLTSTDMKKDLKMLAFIYQWMYPKIKLDIKDFIPTKNNSRDMYSKSIYLDYFLEDFAIRVDNVKAFNSTKNTNYDAVTNQMPKKSRKNKDPTGTKVKRSRISYNDITVSNKHDNDIKVSNENVHNNTEIFTIYKTIKKENITISEFNSTHNVERSKQNDVVECNVSIANEEIDTFCSEGMTFKNAVNDIVRNENVSQKSTESIDFDNFDNKENCDNETKTNISEGNLDIFPNENYSVLYDVVEGNVSIANEEINTLCSEGKPFQNVVNDIVRNENVSEKSTESIDFDNFNNKESCKETKTNISEGNLDICRNEDYSVMNEVVKKENLSEHSTESIDFDNMNVIVDCEKAEMNKSSILDSCTDFIQNNDVVDNNSMIVNDNGHENLHENLTKSIDFENMKRVEDIDDDIKQNLDNLESSEEKPIENVDKPVNSINESLESVKEEKLSDLEESMLKKFKGSFLDSLF